MNDINDTLNDNATDAESRLSSVEGVHGWARYSDGLTSPATLALSTSFQKLEIDGLGSSSQTGYLPVGVSALWDTSTDQITPASVGDSYNVRVDFTITGTSGNPAYIEVALDIGDSQDGSDVVVVERAISAYKSAFSASFTTAIFSLATFVANGGSIWLRTDTGTATLSSRAITIIRTSAG